MNAEPGGFRLAIDRDWPQRNPLTTGALTDDVREWEKVGYALRVPGLSEAVNYSNGAAVE